MSEVKQFHVLDASNRIGIDLKERFFVIGDQLFPFFSPSKELKLVYFVTRQVTVCNNDLDGATEELKVFTVGYEAEEGKIFLNLQEESGDFVWSTTGV